MSFDTQQLHTVKIQKEISPEARAKKRAYMLSKLYDFAAVIDIARGEQGEWQYKGSGDWVTIERCPTSQIKFFNDGEAAIVSFKHANQHGCGHACNTDHYLGVFEKGKFRLITASENASKAVV